MATMPVQTEEEAMVREVIDSSPLPKGLRFRNMKPAVNSIGEPAYRIAMAVSGPFPLPKKRIAELAAWHLSVLMDVRETGAKSWPMIRFEEVR